MLNDDHANECDCPDCSYWNSKDFYLEQKYDEARDLADEMKREERELTHRRVHHGHHLS